MNEQWEVLTVRQAADALQVSTNTLYSLVAQNAIPHLRFGKLIRIPRWGLLQFIARSSGAPLPEDRDVALLPVQSLHVHQAEADNEEEQ